MLDASPEAFASWNVAALYELFEHSDSVVRLYVAVPDTLSA